VSKRGNDSVSSLTPAEAFAALRKELSKLTDDDVPEGFKNCEEWGDEAKMTSTNARDILKLAVKNGRAEELVLRRGNHKVHYFKLK